MGLAQILRGSNGEAEPRLTSGGEAATLPTKALFVQSCTERLWLKSQDGRRAWKQSVPSAVADG
jgi:hypothetical protein